MTPYTSIPQLKQRPSCEDCICFDRQNDNEGLCRKQPCSPLAQRWPTVEVGDFCAEHQDWPHYLMDLRNGHLTLGLSGFGYQTKKPEEASTQSKNLIPPRQ